MSNLTGFGTLGASKLMGKVGYGNYSQYYYDVFETILEAYYRKETKKISNILN